MYGAQLYLDSNVLMFEILFRYSSVIEGTFTLSAIGRPYRGNFEASVYVDVTLVDDIQKETRSVSQVTISQNDNFFSFANQVNADFKAWVKSIVLADNMLMIKKVAYQKEMEKYQAEIDQLN